MRSERKKIISLLLALAMLFVTAATAVAQEAEETQDLEETQTMEEMVVTTTRTEIPLSETTKSIDVVHASDRDDLQQYYLPELLDNLPGVYMKRNGGIGQFSSLSIRGTGTQYTQYQYNGLPLRDAADTQTTLYKADRTTTDWTRKEYLPRNKVDLVLTFAPIEKLNLSCDISWQDEKIVPPLRCQLEQGSLGRAGSDNGGSGRYLQTTAVHGYLCPGGKPVR